MKIISEVLDVKSSYGSARKYDMSSGMIRHWNTKYKELDNQH